MTSATGPAPRIVERQIVTVPDALTFTIQIRGAGTTYRYCPAPMLPNDLPGHAK